MSKLPGRLGPCQASGLQVLSAQRSASGTLHNEWLLGPAWIWGIRVPWLHQIVLRANRGSLACLGGFGGRTVVTRRWRVAEKRSLSHVGSPGPQLEASVDLLEAGPTPGKGVGAQGKQKEGGLLKPREERDKDPAGSDHGRWAAAASLSGQGSRHSDAQFGPYFPLWSWGCDLGAPWEMSQSLRFPCDLGVALNRITCLRQGKRDVISNRAVGWGAGQLGLTGGWEGRRGRMRAGFSAW